MKAKRWMQIAAVASAVGLAGTAIASDTDLTSTPSSPAPEVLTTDQARNGAMNRAAQLDSGAPSRETAARSDESLNAGMNRAAQLGTSTPGAPASAAESAASAPNARMPRESVDQPAMDEDSERSGTANDMTPGGRSEEATPPAGTNDDALSSDDTAPSDAAAVHDRSIILPSDRSDAQAATEVPAPSNAQRKQRLP